MLPLGIPGVGWSNDPPDEGMILLEEIPHLAERSVLYSLPPDPESALAALSSMPEGLDDVIAMHLGRLYPTPQESTPGVAPLVSLLGARADLLLDPQHWDKKLADTMSGEFAILLLPMDATTVIVIMPTQVVESDPQAASLPERPVDLSEVTYEVHGNTRTVEQYMADGATNAIAFMHEGEFVYDAYQNGFTADTRHQMWSVTKSVTTAMVGIAVGEGRVDSVFDPIEKYIPETAGTVWEGTTVEDLLQMESGIYWVDVPVHQPEELILMGLDFHTNGLYGMTRDDYLLKLTRVSKPGECYRYNSADAQIVPEAWVEASHDYSEETGGPRGYMWPHWSDGYTASGYGHQRVSVAPALEMAGVRFGNDPVDSIAPKEWEAVYLAVADALANG